VFFDRTHSYDRYVKLQYVKFHFALCSFVQAHYEICSTKWHEEYLGIIWGLPGDFLNDFLGWLTVVAGRRHPAGMVHRQCLHVLKSLAAM
jgi:hypothetical protein